MKDVRDFLSWNDLTKKEFNEPPFLINPYIPSGGIVFFWGDTSVGKSPLGWHIARSVGSGENFFGLPVQKGRVLYIELDTPERLVAERIRKLPPMDGLVDFLFLQPLSVPILSPSDRELLDRAATKEYNLVIINTLRKCHSMNDKEPQTPKVVYEFFQRTFPGAALVFVHHSKKSQLNQSTGNYEAGLDKESFSGAKNWINDAQVGIYLRRFKNPKTRTNLSLSHEKTQVTAEYAPLLLRLEADGANISCPEAEQISIIRKIMDDCKNGGLLGIRVDEILSKELGISLATARRRRLALEEEVWLPRKDDEDSDT